MSRAFTTYLIADTMPSRNSTTSTGMSHSLSPGKEKFAVQVYQMAEKCAAKRVNRFSDSADGLHHFKELLGEAKAGQVL